MSHFQTPDVAAIDFDCRICGASAWIAQECLDKSECDGQLLELMCPEAGLPTRCGTCVRVGQVIQQLNYLVVMNPYLQTEGMAGKPETPSWEQAESKRDATNAAEESLGDGMDEGERKTFIEKMIQSFQATAGQGMTEQEVYHGESTSQEPGCQRRVSVAVSKESKASA